MLKAARLGKTDFRGLTGIINPMSVLQGKHIMLGVTGSIAAYKAAELASRLAQAGAQVDVVLTEAAEKFITPLTFQSVTGRRTFTDHDLWGGEAHVLHVGLAHSAGLLVVAPCTANTIAKMAHGFAGDLLSVTLLAASCPVLIAPAMDGGMFEAPVTQRNLASLRERGVFIAGPAQGHLASGLVGTGRMLEPSELLGHIRRVLGMQGRLSGRTVLVTAGGTQEPLDPVRFLTNRSSGKQGYALAQAAVDLGAEVVLISTPTALTPPVGARLVPVQTALQMCDAVMAEVTGADALVMAAAVADFRPRDVAADKLKKRDGIPRLELEPAPDILRTVATSPGRPRVVAGFAAESRDLLENAGEKLKAKGLDLIAANDISAEGAGFAGETNRITLLFSNGQRQDLPLMDKSEAAGIIMEHIAALLEG